MNLVVAAFGDRSLNTCADICIGNGCTCGITCRPAVQVPNAQGIVIVQGDERMLQINQLQHSRQRAFSHHNSGKRH